jgi:hypothetical protein
LANPKKDSKEGLMKTKDSQGDASYAGGYDMGCIDGI